jgi:uncharacterized C2H2 Zn-finger protein
MAVVECPRCGLVVASRKRLAEHLKEEHSGQDNDNATR